MKKVNFLIFCALTLAFVSCRKDASQTLNHFTGLTMGTITYNVKYTGQAMELKEEVDTRLSDFNQSLSTYVPDSEISRLNKTGRLAYESEFFYPVLKKSREVFESTSGTFDPSIGPLVQAWGFGPDKKIPELSQSQVDSLKFITGFAKVNFDEEGATLPENFQLDFGAIAKGYAVDLVAEILEGKGIENYLVEIGGEVRTKGYNEKGKSWSLGIEDPLVAKDQRKVLAVVRMKDRSLATSGNYRNYYEKDGRIYAHIIDPRTGYNGAHNLLSASVFASDCMTADAYATAFMVLGLEESFSIADRTPDLDVILVYQDEDGSLRTRISSGIKSFVEMNATK